MDDLESIFSKLDKCKRTIACCQTGTRSTLLYLELRLMGFSDPSSYDESWIVYGNNINYSAANENWYDFVRVNDAIRPTYATSCDNAVTRREGTICVKTTTYGGDLSQSATQISK
jgi:hypothetical protein